MVELHGKLNINIGNTGHKKIDKNYSEVAKTIDKTFENEYCKLTLESMASDPAYLIYEYNLKLKDKAIQEIGGEVLSDKYEGYKIFLENQLFINDKEIKGINSNWDSIEKLDENQFRIVTAYNIANIRENSLNTVQKLKKLYINGLDLKVIINEEVTAKINFNNKDKKVLAKTELSNGSTLYIEDVANSKFENYVLARIVSKGKHYNEIYNKENEFMIEDPQFAICDQDGNSINFEDSRLEEYYEILSDDGEILSTEDTLFEEEENLIRIVQVQLLRLSFDENNIPTKLKILPLNRKLYNDRNASEYEFYKNEDWYQVKVGENKIKEETVMGSVTITKIEETDDELIFYYDTDGFVPNNVDFVLRVKSPEMNYVYPRENELKFVDGNENKIIYSKDTSLLAGMSKFGILTNNKIDNVDELEFAMFYNVKYDKLSEPLEFDWSLEESIEKGLIENIEFKEYMASVNDDIETGYKIFEGEITEINENRLKFYSEEKDEELIITNPKDFKYCDRETKEDIEFSDIEVGDNLYVASFENLKHSKFEKNGLNPEDYRKISITKK